MGRHPGHASVLAAQPPRRYRDGGAQRRSLHRRPAHLPLQQDGRGASRADARQALCAAWPAADGRSRPCRLPRRGAAVVHAGSARRNGTLGGRLGGPHRQPDRRPRRSVRLHQGNRGAVFDPRHHAPARPAGGRRRSDPEAVLGAGRTGRSGAPPGRSPDHGDLPGRLRFQGLFRSRRRRPPRLPAR